MGLSQVPAGEQLPEDIYVIIEIPCFSGIIKYEINKNVSSLFVDRFSSAPMHYPCNYGYINHTLSMDNDPIDVLVPTPCPLIPGSIIRCRPIGMLRITDESGEDVKIIAVPHSKLSKEYDYIKDIHDFPVFLREKITHFFKHYKDLENEKWVKINGWENSKLAKIEIMKSFNRAKKFN